MIKVRILAFLFFFLTCSNSKEIDTWKVYYLGGQSNMDGYGYNSKLPDSLNIEIENAMIFDGLRDNTGSSNGGVGKWEKIKPGHGYGFSTDGYLNSLSNRFGPELSFASTLSQYGDKIAIIKYSFGGTALYPGAGYGNWSPDEKNRNHYDNALATIKNAFQVIDINEDGSLDKLIPSGIVWMQGEADASHSQQAADAYLNNLTKLMSQFRTVFKNQNLPVIIGKINDSYMTPNGDPTQPFIDLVQLAQIEFTDNDKCASYVTEIDSYEFSSDAWHYDTEGFIKMGTAFAKAIKLIEDNCK